MADTPKFGININDGDETIANNINAVKGLNAKLSRGFSGGSGSIIKAARSNIFEFPVFISSSVPLDYATATTSLLEQVYASYLQMALSINPIIDNKSAVSGRQFDKFKSNTNKYLECADESYMVDACHNVLPIDSVEMGYRIEDGKIIEFSLMSIDDKDAYYFNEYLNYEPLSEFNHFFQEAKQNAQKGGLEQWQALNQQINDLNNRIKDYEKQIADKDDEIEESKSEKAQLQLRKLREEVNNLERRYDGMSADEWDKNRTVDQYNLDVRKYNAELDKFGKEYDLKLKDDTRKEKEESRKAEEHEWKKQDRVASKLKGANDSRTRAPQMMDETKIQKLNTMKPLMMTVDMNVESKDGGLHGIQYAVGVKCHTRLVDADILPEVAEYPLKEMDRITRKAKWRAGELKFFKDILFEIKQKKQTAIDSKDPRRKWYRRLYELAHMKGDAPAHSLVSGNGIIKTFFKDKSQYGVIPNASIVISKADVDIIKRETKIDMLKGSTAAHFCKELFLIGIIVIDYDAESISMLMPDIHNDYEVHSLAAVNKQISLLDTAGAKTREIFKALG